MTNDELFSAVVEWIGTVTGLPTIRAYQSGDRPGEVYVEVNFMNLRDVREHVQTVKYVGDAGPVTATPVIEAEWFYSVHAYGEGGDEALRRLNSARRLAELAQSLGRGVFIHDMSLVRYLPEFVNAAWEPRANVDLFIRALTREGFIINVIDQVSFDFERA